MPERGVGDVGQPVSLEGLLTDANGGRLDPEPDKQAPQSLRRTL